jgi:hypothetical protein
MRPITAGGASRGGAYLYFLGSGVPTGAQTVSVDWDASATTIWGASATVTAASNTGVVASGVTFEDRANPQVTIDSGAVSAMIYYTIFSGHNTVGDLTLIANQTAGISEDFGGFIGRLDRETDPATGSRAVGYTGASDQCAMVAGAVAEVSAVISPYYSHYYSRIVGGE